MRVTCLGERDRSYKLRALKTPVSVPNNLDRDGVIAERDSEQAEVGGQIVVREAKALIAKLEAMELTVLIEAPKPVFAAPAFRCSDWFNRMNPIGRHGFAMDRDFLLEHRAAAMRSIAEVRERLTKYTFAIVTADEHRPLNGSSPAIG